MMNKSLLLLAFCLSVLGLIACGPSGKNTGSKSNSPVTSNESPTTTTSISMKADTNEVKPTVQPTPFPQKKLPAPTNLSNNLIPDPGYRDLNENWTVKFENNPAVQNVSIETVSLPNNMEKIQSLKIATDQWATVSTKSKIPVDPTKTYRFSVWVRQEPANAGARYFGFLPYNGTETTSALTTGACSDPSYNLLYFVDQGSFKDTEWHQLVGYMLSSNSENWIHYEDATQYTFKFTPDTKAVTVRFLNYYNRGKECVNWFALPELKEIDPVKKSETNASIPTIIEPKSSLKSDVSTATVAVDSNVNAGDAKPDAEVKTDLGGTASKGKQSENQQGNDTKVSKGKKSSRSKNKKANTKG